MKLSVLIPVFNEVQAINVVLQRVATAPVDLEKAIIVVDDGSTDGTREILKSCTDITVIFHNQNAGKEAALRTGLEYITGDIFIIQNIDLEYNPRDYPTLLASILQDEVDAAYGSRFLGAHIMFCFSGIPWPAVSLPF
ncbi:MAG: glycosyltransferase family 2 protein [Candidatus Binatia bacterium]